MKRKDIADFLNGVDKCEIDHVDYEIAPWWAYKDPDEYADEVDDSIYKYLNTLRQGVIA